MLIIARFNTNIVSKKIGQSCLIIKNSFKINHLALLNPINYINFVTIRLR